MVSRLTRPLQTAKLHLQAAPEDLDFRTPRGLDKGLLISGPTGTGKSYLACALGHRACRLVHNAHRITLKGAYMRRAKSPTQHSDPLA